jgi:energy-coupling factor transport system substrate-specific component
MSSKFSVVDSPRRTRAQYATGRLWEYRTVDLVVLAVLAVTAGVIFWGWDKLYNALLPATTSFPPVIGLTAGVWTLGAAFGAFLVRRPGAALFGELVAATVENLLGNQWGFAVFYPALFYGLGVELLVALFRWRRFDVVTVSTGIALGSVAEGFYELHAYYSGYSTSWQIWQVVTEVVSGFVLGGVLGWAIIRALAATGTLQAFPAGREFILRQAANE